MAGSAIIEVCEEVVTALNTELASQGYDEVATRKYNPIVRLQDLCDLRCVVYPASNASETRMTRGMRDHEYAIQVLVQKKLGTPNTTAWYDEIDTLTELVDSLADLFRPAEEIGTSLARCTQVDIDPIFAVEHINDKNLFSSVINLTFMQLRTPD